MVALLLTLPAEPMSAADRGFFSIPGGPLTLQEAQEEIDMLKNITLALCGQFRKELGGDSLYVVKLACAFAKRTHNCMCVPKQEHIPIINEKNIERFNKYDSCEKLTEEIQTVSAKVGDAASKPTLREKFGH